MIRSILGVVAGLAAFVAVVTLASPIMRVAWPEYARVAEAMTFTLPMMIARLAIGAVATLAAGWTAVAVAGQSRLTRFGPGVVLLAGFIPQHIALWAKFPVWYHFTFLLSLIPLTYAGGRRAAR